MKQRIGVKWFLCTLVVIGRTKLIIQTTEPIILNNFNNQVLKGTVKVNGYMSEVWEGNWENC